MAVEQNLACVEAKREPCRLLPLHFLSLAPVDLDATPVSPEALPAPRPRAILFADDFSGGTLPWDRYVHGGYLAQVMGGALRIFTTGYGHVGWVETRPLDIDPSHPIIMRRRVWLHPANHYLDAQLAIDTIG